MEFIIFTVMLLFTGFCAVILSIGIVEIYGNCGNKEEEEDQQTNGNP